MELSIGSPNKSFVTAHDQCPRRSFDTELKECQSYSPKQITLCRKFSGQNSRMKNGQRAITLKAESFELWFLCTALLLNEIYLPMNFQVSSLISFLVMLRTKFKNENEQTAITPKAGSFKLWFLCTALLLHLPIKFHVDALHRFKVMLWTKKGQTDRKTEILKFSLYQ